MNEARFVRQRRVMQASQDAVLMQAVVASVISRQGGDHLRETLEDLRHGC